jgi:superfamily I DNA/RNA helicase
VAPSDGACSDILAGLDPDQRAAAEIADGALLVVAGPGSGKTRTLTHRLAHLIADRGVPASACLAITFTRRAAAELRERLANLIPAGGGAVAIHTFHSLGLAILREHGAGAGLAESFRIAGEAERVTLLAESLGVTAARAERLLRTISRHKRTGTPAEGEAAEAMGAYERALAARNLLDFDDLIGKAVALLAAAPTIAAQIRARLRCVCVDEFQDVDPPQYALLRLITPQDGSLSVIGDPDQAIYGFRGADASCFDRFLQDFSGVATVRLKRNYRSSGTIVTAASQIIAPARPEAGIAELVRAMHERIAVHVAPTADAEAEFVVKTIEELIGGHSFFSIDSGRARHGGSGDLSFADFAVLYRTEAQAGALRTALSRSGMPFKQGSREAIAEQPAVRSLLEELGRESRAATIDAALEEAARRRATAAGADAAAIAEALRQLKLVAESCGEDRARFADAVALAAEADFYDPRADRVSLLTMHAAKGLEFKIVFIVGLEDGLTPLYWGALDAQTQAQERRLFYVAVTRAKDRLFLSRARARQWRGRSRKLDPSPYLRDIEAELLRHAKSELPHRPQDRQLRLF